MNAPVDRVFVALGSIGTGAAVGGSFVTAGLLVLRASQGRGLVHTPISFSSDMQATLFVGSIFVGLVGAVAVAWRLSEAIPDGWRRSVTAALAGFGTCFLAFLAAPAEMLGGGPGLVGYLGTLVLGATAGRAFTRRAAGNELPRSPGREESVTL